MGKKHLGLAPLLAFSLLAVGCGGGKSAEEKQLDDMRDELTRVQQTSDRFEERLDKLEVDQVAKPSDVHVGAPKQAAPRPPAGPVATPQLRVVRIGPDGNEETSASSETAASDGDASDGSPRPVIKIQGSGSEGVITDEHGRRTRKGPHQDRIEETLPPEDAAPAPPGPHSSRAPALDRDAKVAYDEALSLVNAKRFPEALDAFAGFLVRWPDHPNADNAMFWRGECYYAQGQYAPAAEQFEGVLARFPMGNKVPDSLLKLGMARQKLGDPQAAKQAFDKLRRDYPHSDAARRLPEAPAKNEEENP
jgi:tol-pal system protein YbgF